MITQPEDIRCFENYITEYGWGIATKFLLGIVCACNIVRAFTFVALTYTVCMTACSPSTIPESNALHIFSAYLIGSGLVTIITSSLSDRYGRRQYLCYSLVILFFATFIAAFAFNIYVVVGAALLIGLGMETCAIQSRLLVIEILNKESRGTWTIFCNIFWSIGYVLTAFIIILMQTTTFLKHYESLSQNISTWRILLGISGGLNLSIACACALVEESPRYYLYVGKHYTAFLLLKQVFAINKSSFSEYFKIRSDELRDLIQNYELHYEEPERSLDKCKKFLWRTWSSLKLIFSRRFRGITFLIMTMKIPLIVVGVFQLNIFLTKEITSMYVNLTRTHGGLDFILPVLRPLSYAGKENLNATPLMCQEDEGNHIFYKYFIFLTLASLFGEFYALTNVDLIGRKLVLFINFFLTSISFELLTFLKYEILQIFTSCLIIALINSSISVVILVNLESFPTAIRSTSNAVTGIPGSILAVFFTYFVTITEIDLVNIVLGVVYFCLSILACFLPELKRKPMIE